MGLTARWISVQARENLCRSLASVEGSGASNLKLFGLLVGNAEYAASTSRLVRPYLGLTDPLPPALSLGFSGGSTPQPLAFIQLAGSLDARHGLGGPSKISPGLTDRLPLAVKAGSKCFAFNSICWYFGRAAWTSKSSGVAAGPHGALVSPTDPLMLRPSIAFT